MTTEDRVARLERQVMDLSEMVLALSGRCLALGVAVGNSPPRLEGCSSAGAAPTTAALLDRVYASLLATHVSSEFLAGFQETAQAISDAAGIIDTIEGKNAGIGQ